MESSQNEYGLLKSVLLKHPSKAFIDNDFIEKHWQDLNYNAKPDLQKAIEEYDSFVEVINSTNTDIIYLDSDVNTGLDSIYTRDASITTDQGMIVCNMGKEVRTGEPAVQKLAYEQAGIKVLGGILIPGTIEGGDVAWIDQETLVVGRGYRTNPEGIRQLTNLLDGIARVIEVQLLHYKGPSDVFHLMSVFSPVDRDLAVVYSPLMSVPFRELLLSKEYKLVEVPDEEFDSMGCNVLAISPRKCLVVKGNNVTKKRLEHAGARVIEYSGEEISLKGCGGPTCLTRPLKRAL